MSRHALERIRERITLEPSTTDEALQDAIDQAIHLAHATAREILDDGEPSVIYEIGAYLTAIQAKAPGFATRAKYFALMRGGTVVTVLTQWQAEDSFRTGKWVEPKEDELITPPVDSPKLRPPEPAVSEDALDPEDVSVVSCEYVAISEGRPQVITPLKDDDAAKRYISDTLSLDPSREVSLFRRVEFVARKTITVDF